MEPAINKSKPSESPVLSGTVPLLRLKNLALYPAGRKALKHSTNTYFYKRIIAFHRKELITK